VDRPAVAAQAVADHIQVIRHRLADHIRVIRKRQVVPVLNLLRTGLRVHFG
jgi:hypothetical protein